MQLILWRHAEAVDDAPTDHARALTPRGHNRSGRHQRPRRAATKSIAFHSSPAGNIAFCAFRVVSQIPVSIKLMPAK